jgi:hypothetical protein
VEKAVEFVFLRKKEPDLVGRNLETKAYHVAVQTVAHGRVIAKDKEEYPSFLGLIPNINS